MPSISHKYFEKLRKEVQAYEQWLGQTVAQQDGSAKASDLLDSFKRANSIYIKALELYRTTADDSSEDNDNGEKVISTS
jgi:hypothetical protein